MENNTINKIYETIGKLYMELLFSSENNKALSQQLATLQEQHTKLQEIMNNKTLS